MTFVFKRGSAPAMKTRDADSDVRAMTICMEEAIWDAELHLSELARVDIEVAHRETAMAAARRGPREQLIAAKWWLLDAKRLGSLHARGFVVAVAQVREVLVTLKKLPKDPAVDVGPALGRLDRNVPSLKHARDGLAHASDRWLRRSNVGPIPLDPSGGYRLSGAGKRDGEWRASATAPDGSVAEIVANQATLDHVVAAAQAAIDLFPWHDPLLPRTPAEAAGSD